MANGKRGGASLVMPREHGVWAMFVVPYLFGVFLVENNVLHLLAGPGLLCGFIAVNAALVLMRQPKLARQVLRTLLVFGGVAAICLAYPLLHNALAFWPLVVMGICAAGSIWFIHSKQERHFLNDLLGIVGLTMLLPVSAALGGGAPTQELLTAMALNVAYFTGSVFFVKAVFREKNNRMFQSVGIVYHLLLLALPLVLPVPALFSLIFVPGIVKMAIAAKKVKLPVKTVGIMEIVNVLWFLAGGYVVLGTKLF
ncbi:MULTISPECIES: YwiC-like family protein [Brevibacillus]|uniref:YwiC-like family protein n=1 Tax=Brevibacillus TaxID=55080 RepID=UPI000EDAA320|nr:YwiC-like family protein [Brevibacillus sp.]MBU8715495.1 YwiC-like family protein [Brevibacillus parabrevis]HBZ78988.1 hypothetical protein [Brevibacillus sp.]